MAKVKVEMLVNTAYQGPRREGEVISVPEDFAYRWVKNGIAKLVEESGNVEGEKVPANYESMSAKKLYELCQERGIEVEAKKAKAYYIEKLEADDEGADDEEGSEDAEEEPDEEGTGEGESEDESVEE